MKLLTVTWSENDKPNIDNSFLMKSFLKTNNQNDIINIHFDRRNYRKLEKEFNQRFGYQYEFLLYRIFLLKNELEKLKLDVVIFSDTNDVVCLDNIQKIKIGNLDKIIFSSESHRYPNEENIKNWSPNYEYPFSNKSDLNYLNAGLSIGTSFNFIKLFNECIDNIFTFEYKNFGGDQGIFTYYYLNNNRNTQLIELDKEFNIFLSTYSKSYNDFKYVNDKIISLKYNTSPFFVHDNGWNYGSPKFINHFGLL